MRKFECEIVEGYSCGMRKLLEDVKKACNKLTDDGAAIVSICHEPSNDRSDSGNKTYAYIYYYTN